MDLTVTNDMAKSSAAINLPEWQAFSAKDPAGAARELTRRMHTQLSETQQRAVFAWMQTERDLAATFERFAGTLAPLAGVPYALKDVFQVSPLTIRAGSRFPTGVLPTKDRDGKFPHVLRGVGAVLCAKTNLHEFAYGLTGENPHYGDCEHPHDPGRTSGGSSSGSAAVVAAGIVPFATGTDTGGSIRVPASFCGVYGLRTSAQHPWIEDAFPLAPSFDAAGWFTGNAQDMHTIHRFLLGATKPERELRGCYMDFAALGLTADPEVAEAVSTAAATYAPAADKTTAEQLRVGLASASEAYAVLQSTEAYKVHEAWLDVHRELYSTAVWERIDRGRHWTTAQLDKAHAQHAAIKLLWTNYFLTYDFLILPATPFPALKKSECTQENRDRLLALNAPASLGGLPVLTVPVALPSGLTSGLQIIVNSNQSPVIPWVLKRP
jgi:amidase/aspartyl-tRNA(Asn)/glutamyl-tRNA(Gln) amidotransferase subunit A